MAWKCYIYKPTKHGKFGIVRQPINNFNRYRLIIDIFKSYYMIKIFTSITSILLVSSLFAQQVKRQTLDKELNTPNVIVLAENESISIDDFETNLTKLLKLNSNERFKIIKRKKIDNREYIKLQQTVNGIDVFGGVYTVHAVDGKITKFTGKYYANIQPKSSVLSKENALNVALNYFGSEKYLWEDPAEEKLVKRIRKDENATYFPQPKLIYYPSNKEVILAYVMDVYSQVPHRGEKVFVNSDNGQIINTHQLYHDVDKDAVGISKFSDTVHIMTTEESPGIYSLRDATKGGGVETYDLNESSSVGDAIDFLHGDTIWDITNEFKDEVAIDAHWGAGVTYDYYMQKHSRNSYDDNGTVLLSYVHYLENWSNAQWSGDRMQYGDGSVNGNPYLGLDIVGHEISHGVTQWAAGLIYQGESGALNESFSDIFGNAIEHYADSNRAEWLVGEQCFNTLRDMSNPNEYNNPDTYEGVYWASTTQGAFDNGGVHINSGVQNYWYYLLVEGGEGVNDNGDSFFVSPMGWDVASEIAYRNLEEYLSQSSDFMDARNYSYEVAADMFGECSPECENVIEAWYAVGVGSRLDADVNPSFSMNKSFTCSLPVTVTFNNYTPEEADFYWDFGDGSESSQISPENTYNNEGIYTITLESDLVNQCFSSNKLITKQLEIIELGSMDSSTCKPTTFNQSNSMGINRVLLNDLDYQSGLEDDYYEDYTCESNTTLHVDSTYSMSVFSGDGTNENVRVWIDFNDDKEFTENELIMSIDATRGEHKADVSFDRSLIAVFKKPIRMRVISDIVLNKDITPCGELRFGQTEDYSVAMVYGDGDLSVKGNVNPNLVIYPNPVKDILTVTNTEKILNISILDLSGKSIISVNNQNLVDVSTLSKGIYIARVETLNGVSTSKIIKD